MKYIRPILLLIMLSCLWGCQEKIDSAPPIDIKGTWRGSLANSTESSHSKYLYVKMNDCTVEVSSTLGPKSGWHDGYGTYVFNGGKVTFDIELETPSYLIGDKSVPKYKIICADAIRSGINNEWILKLHYNKTLNGEQTSS